MVPYIHFYLDTGFEGDFDMTRNFLNLVLITDVCDEALVCSTVTQYD